MKGTSPVPGTGEHRGQVQPFRDTFYTAFSVPSALTARKFFQRHVTTFQWHVRPLHRPRKAFRASPGSYCPQFSDGILRCMEARDRALVFAIPGVQLTGSRFALAPGETKHLCTAPVLPPYITDDSAEIRGAHLLCRSDGLLICRFSRDLPCHYLFLRGFPTVPERRSLTKSSISGIASRKSAAAIARFTVTGTLPTEGIS